MSRTFYLLGHIEEKEEIMSYFLCGEGHRSKGFMYMSHGFQETGHGGEDFLHMSHGLGKMGVEIKIFCICPVHYIILYNGKRVKRYHRCIPFDPFII